MLTRVKTFTATGIATAGRLYAGDLNAIQDAVAAITDLAQTVSVAVIEIGETGLQIVKFATGELRATGGFRADGKILAGGGMYSAAFTTTQRNAITSPPTGLIIWNSTTGQYEHNKGTAGTPNWQPLTFALQSTVIRRVTGIGGATWPTTIPFDTEDKDDLGAWAIGTPTKVFIPTTGTYEAVANSVTTGQTGSGAPSVQLSIDRYNAANSMIKTQAYVQAFVLDSPLSCSAVFQANAGEWIGLDYGLQATGLAGVMTADLSVTRMS